MRLRPAATTLTALTIGLAATATDAAATVLPDTTSAVTTPAAEPLVPLPATGTVAVLGKGYGHGRGMSQFGAAAAATAGQTWKQITARYYPGALATTSPTTSLRVGLVDSIGAGLRVLPVTGLAVTGGTTTRILPTTVTLAGTASPVVRWEVRLPAAAAAGATLWFVTADGRQGAYATAPGSWTFTAPSGRLRVTSAAGVPGATYLGTLSGIQSGSTIQPVLRTTLESYVRMVVPSEAYTSWPVQALAAQAVAARTYAVSYLRTSSSTLSDICSSTRCQVVGGIQTETAGTRAGVEATTGIVLTSGGIPLRAEFSSSNGGMSVDGGASYLPAQADPFDHSTLNPNGSWRVDLPVAKIASAFPAVGRPTGIQVLARDGRGELGGRVLSARVVGTLGSKTMTGDALRTALGATTVKSTLFTFAATPSRTAATTAGPLLATSSTSLLTSTGGTVRTVTAAPTSDLRLLTRVGEWDAVPGVDALGISPAGDLVLVSCVGTTASTRRVVAGGFADATGLASFADMNGDRQRDLVVARSGGRLVRYTANGTGGLLPGAGTLVGGGWSTIPVVLAADLTGDGLEELVAQLADGTVVRFPAYRDVFGARVTIGRLTGYRSLTSVGDRTGDGRADLVALDAAGTAWLVPVTATGLGAPVRLAAMTGGLRLL